MVPYLNPNQIRQSVDPRQSLVFNQYDTSEDKILKFLHECKISAFLIKRLLRYRKWRMYYDFTFAILSIYGSLEHTPLIMADSSKMLKEFKDLVNYINEVKKL